jgi:hypothetical protein
VARAAHADACRAQGCLHACHGRRVPRVLLDAAHVVAAGRARRDRYEARQRDQKHAADLAALKARTGRD